jgi:hypothetical protein
VLARWALTAEEKLQGPARYQPRDDREPGVVPLADAIIRIAHQKIARKAPGMPASFEGALAFWDHVQPDAEETPRAGAKSAAGPMRPRRPRREATTAEHEPASGAAEQDAAEVEDVDA